MEEQMVDVNKASVEILETLKGVGRAKAEAIVSTRERLGFFQNIDEIRQVPGIGKSLLEQNKDILKCCPQSPPASHSNPLRRSLRKGQKPQNNCRLLKGKDYKVRKMTNSNEKEKVVGHNTRTEQNGGTVGDSSANYRDGMEYSANEARDLPNHRVSDDGEEEVADEVDDLFDFDDDSEVNCKDHDRSELGIVIQNRKFSDSSANSETSKQLRQRLDTSSNLDIDNSIMSGLGNDTPHEEGTSDLPLDVPLSPMRLTDGEDMEMDNEEDGIEAEADHCNFDEEDMMVTDEVSTPLPDKKQNKRKSEVCSDSKGVCPVKKTCKAIDTSNGCDRIKSSTHHCHKLPPPVGLKPWLTKYQSWTPTQKLAALDSLIDICDLSQVRHIHQVILPQFQRDFITLLPKELALYVLSFLEPKDLLSAAQTCKYWNMLTADNLLWREKCREAGLDDDIVLQHQKRKKGSSVSTVGHTSPYKAAFMRQHQIEMNWRVTPLRTPRSLKGHDDHVITCLQFSGNTIVSGSDDNTLKVWNATSGKCMRTLSGHTGGVWSSQMCDNLIVSGSTDRMLKVWDADTGECIHTLYGHTSTVRCLHLHGKKVVSGSRDATLRVWDLTTGACEHVLVGHVAAVRCVQYNGKLVVSGAYDYMVKVWDPEKEECLHTLTGHTNRVYSLQFDGVHVVSGSLDTSIRVWDVQTGQCMHTLMGHQSLTSGMELKNNILISGNADSTVKVWDILTGQCLQTLSGPHKHRSAVTCLQFNNKFVVTSSDDGTVKLWDVKTGEFIRNLVALDSGGSGGVVWRIRASDTKLVCAVGSRNGTEETKLLVLDFDVHDSPTK